METISTVVIRKRRIDLDERMSAKALLLEMFPEIHGAGQLILHFNPGRNALFCEWQEREERAQPQLALVANVK